MQASIYNTNNLELCLHTIDPQLNQIIGTVKYRPIAGMSHSTDSYHNQPAGGQYRPHTGKPIPTPRIQGGSETSGRRPPAHYGTGQQQLHQGLHVYDITL